MQAFCWYSEWPYALIIVKSDAEWLFATFEFSVTKGHRSANKTGMQGA